MPEKIGFSKDVSPVVEEVDIKIEWFTDVDIRDTGIHSITGAVKSVQGTITFKDIDEGEKKSFIDDKNFQVCIVREANDENDFFIYQVMIDYEQKKIYCYA